MVKTNEDVMSVTDLANMLSVSKACIYSKIYNKTLGLPYVKVGAAVRFFKADVDAWLEAKKAESLE